MKSNARPFLWLAAALGVVLYIVLAWQYANNQSSILDEGAYLVKGLYFLEGRYTPYQAYGPRTNHMPLAFLIPGVVQKVFGPGLGTGRIFSIVLAALGLVLLWAGIRRWAGDGWAAAAVWLVALNPAGIKMYSTATSQPLIFCLLAAILLLGLGQGRKTLELVFASVLAGVLALTRINLSPVLPLFVLYVFLVHGRKTGLIAAAGGFGTAVLILAVYWPEILGFLSEWVPTGTAAFLDPYRLPDETLFWDPTPGLDSRLVSFFSAFRFHFAAFVGAVFAWLLIDRPLKQLDRDHRMALGFLSLTFLLLFGMHIYASLVLNYCVFCFSVYVSFFTILAIYILFLTIPSWPETTSPARRWLGLGFTVLLLTGMGFSAFELFGEGILALRIPRFKDFSIQPGSIEIWGLLNNRFGWSYTAMLRIAPAVVGMVLGLLLVFGFLFIRRLSRRRAASAGGVPFRAFAACVVFAGALLAPARALGGGYISYDCGDRIIASYASVGADLAGRIPPGSRVYWQGTLSAAPLLYLDHPEIFPAQLNLDYSFRLSGDPDDLERHGLWNESLARSWLEQSDFVIVSERYFTGWLADAIREDDGLMRVYASDPVESCNPETRLYLYQRES